MKLLFEFPKSIEDKSRSFTEISRTKSVSYVGSININPKPASIMESPRINSKPSSSLKLVDKNAKTTSSINSPSNISNSSEFQPTKSSNDHRIKTLTQENIDSLLSKKTKIGTGATSTVYRVRNIFTNKGCLALKILNNALFKMTKEDSPKTEKPTWGDEDDENFEEEEEVEVDMNKIKNLYMEYEILKNLNHPNIIKIYGFYIGDKNHPPSILLEYCKYNLEKAIKFLDEIDLIGIIYEICSAMMYIHKMKIIHRDLKTTNILIDANKHVKICDFGISKVMDLTSQTTSTHMIGTFLYMAPELFRKDTKCNEKIDVYAFGVVAYFILTKGQYPQVDRFGGLEGTQMPAYLNRCAKSLIKNCWHSSEKRPGFGSLRKFITSNNFMLFDGIESQIPALKKHLGLEK